MEPGHWSSEHSDALRDYFYKGLSYAEIGLMVPNAVGSTSRRTGIEPFSALNVVWPSREPMSFSSATALS